MTDWPEGAAAYLECPRCGGPGMWLRQTAVAGGRTPTTSMVFRDDGRPLTENDRPECQQCCELLQFHMRYYVERGASDE